MTNEAFQKLVLEKLGALENGQKDLKADFMNMKTRQDDVYQVVRAIEHSNEVGRSELDSQNIRLAKIEGKIKKVSKAYNEDVDVDRASNL